MPVAVQQQPVSAPFPPPFLPEKAPLCSDVVQVRRGIYNSIKIKELEKEAVVDWLDGNGYKETAGRVENCGTTFVHLADDRGHEKYVRMHCNRDYCPECGRKGSQAHKKRVVRALDRLLWSKVLGYMIFTLPKEISCNMPDPEGLSTLSKSAWDIVKKNFKTPGGMVRIHLLGGEPGQLHIHINVLFPITREDGRGQISQEALEKIRKEWTAEVNALFDLTYTAMNIYYKFSLQKGRMIHKIKYVLRAVVVPDKFLALSDDDRHRVLSLTGWHNTRWFGRLANAQYKKFLLEKGVDVTTKENDRIETSSVCPVCGEKMRFKEIVSASSVPRKRLRCIDRNVLVDFAIYSALKDQKGAQFT